jgi:hypothetical protein
MRVLDNVMHPRLHLASDDDDSVRQRIPLFENARRLQNGLHRLSHTAFRIHSIYFGVLKYVDVKLVGNGALFGDELEHPLVRGAPLLVAKVLFRPAAPLQRFVEQKREQRRLARAVRSAQNQAKRVALFSHPSCLKDVGPNVQ